MNDRTTYGLDVPQTCETCDGTTRMRVEIGGDPNDSSFAECDRCDDGTRTVHLAFRGPVAVLAYVDACVAHGIEPILDDDDRIAISRLQHAIARREPRVSFAEARRA